MNKGVKRTIIITLIISIILSIVLYLGMSIFKKNKTIIWPIINESNLDKSIYGYDGEYNNEKFKSIFKKDVDSSLKKQGINKEEIEYSFTDYNNKIEVLVNAHNHTKKYSFELIDNFIGII